MKISQIRVKREDKKCHAIWNFWDVLLSYKRNASLCNEVRALYKLYEERDDGILHLAHALALVYYDVRNSLPRIYHIDSCNSSFDEDCWTKIYESQIPVMNDAIDTHTRHGKKFLGRDSLFFLERGCILKDHHKFPDEDEIYNNILNEELARKEQHLFKKPRAYQRIIAEKAIDFFESSENYKNKAIDEVEGCLHMACGTGKSLTSYWIADHYIENNSSPESTRILVVTPRLQVLTQFYRVYRDCLINNNRKSVVGVLCSDFDRPKAHDMCYHLHLKTEEDLEEFYKCYLITGCEEEDQDKEEVKVEARFYDAKVLFTTYKSLAKVKQKTERTNGMWDLVIYDEAHHMQDEHRVTSTRTLLLSATPRHDQKVIASYSYHDAIKEKTLVPFKIHVANLNNSDAAGLARIKRLYPNVIVEDTERIDHSIDFIMHGLFTHRINKLIVFSAMNKTAKELHDKCKERLKEIDGIEVKTFYIDHKIRMKDREPIIRQWVNAKKAVFFNCSILGEGVDFLSVDGIYIESGHISEKMVIQAAGRPLRIDPENPHKIAHILLGFGENKEYHDTVRRISYLYE
jgi:superfamily II DNA or RNA helicase